MANSMAWWRRTWGRLGDVVAELSSVRELLEDKRDKYPASRLEKAEYETLINELATAESECRRIRRALQDLRRRRGTP